MSSPPFPPCAVTLFAGGRGGATIARELLRTRSTELSLVINGYDNGLSSGALRRYLPGMLGPSDFRKNLLLHLDSDDAGQVALIWMLTHRLPRGATRQDLSQLIDAIAAPASAAFAHLPPQARAGILRELTVFRHWHERHSSGLDLADCALGNLVFAGSYLRLAGDFNAAVAACAATFGSPARLLNVTAGQNAFLVALKQNGKLLADEAEIVGPQDGGAITDLFLLREPVTWSCRDELTALPPQQLRQELARRSARVTLNPQAGDAIRYADLLLYGPGTPHSSLLPSYLTPGIADAIMTSSAIAKVFVVNMREDHDVTGMAATELVERTLSYLGDPFNHERTITHVLQHQPAGEPAVPGGRCPWAGMRWVTADLEDPRCPGMHCGRRTVAALAGIVGEEALVKPG
jgi:2-phospho-L-lactate transferase/gluconeogenesis factor (CofD/UPF0052 family)